MNTTLILHSLALVIINVITYWIAAEWNSWTHDLHPSAAAIPLGAAVSVIGFLSWYHCVNSITAARLKLTVKLSWIRSYVTVIILGAILFFLLPNIVSGNPFSTGRLLAFTTFQLISNAIVLAIAYPQREADSPRILRLLLKRRSFKATLLTTSTIFGCVILFAMLEVVFYGLNSTGPAGPTKVYEGEYLSPEFSDYDPILGKRLLPNADALCRLKVNDETIWNVRYTTDEHGRRTTVVPDTQTASQFAVFFGCSFLFGEGGNDAETIPSQFAAAAPQFRPYNYGVPGYGTQHMLAKLQSNSIRHEVAEKNGIAIYLYLEEIHEPRAIGGMQVTNSFGEHFPYYDFNADGELQRFGNFSTGRPVLTHMYGLLGKSQFIKYMGLNFPQRRDEHFRIVARMIERSRELCQQQLNCNKFYVVCYPRKNAHGNLLPYLQTEEITVLDYSSLFDPNGEGMFHKGDGHPTPLANHQLSRQLALDVDN